MTEIVIPNFDDSDDLPLPTFPAASHASQNSFDSTSSSTQNHSKRSASPFLRRFRGDSSASETNPPVTPSAFSFPHQQNGSTYGRAGGTTKSPARPTFKQRSASSAPTPHQSQAQSQSTPQPPLHYASPYGTNHSPTAATSSTSIHSFSAHTTGPAKKGSFANLKNAFKAATSGMHDRSHPGPSAMGTITPNTPGAHAVTGSGASAGYPALKNPFGRSFSSNALAHSGQASSLRSTQAVRSRPSESSSSNGTGVLGMGGKMYRPKDRSGNRSQDRSGVASNSSNERRAIGVGSSSGSIGSRIMGNRSVEHEHPASGSGTPESFSPIRLNSPVSSSGNGRRIGVGVQPGQTYSHGHKKNASSSKKPPSLSSAPLTSIPNSTSGPSSAGSRRAGNHGGSLIEQARQIQIQKLIAASEGASAGVEGGGMPKPREPGEILMHELFRHFVNKSEHKLEGVLSRPLFAGQGHGDSPLLSLREGEDVAFDDLLRSLAVTARDYGRQVVNLVVSWGQSQTHAEQETERQDDDRVRELMAFLNERRVLAARYIVYRTLSDIIRQSQEDTFDRELAIELEDSVFESYAAEEPNQLATNHDRQSVAGLALSILGTISENISSHVVERFLAKLSPLVMGADVLDDAHAQEVVRHLLKGLTSLPDPTLFSDPNTLEALSSLFSQCGSATLREVIAAELRPLICRLESAHDTSSFASAITAISNQADRLTKQQGTWSVGFLLDVSTAVLASDADFETRWRYYVGQAAETLRNHQNRSDHPVALQGMLQILQNLAKRQARSTGMLDSLWKALPLLLLGDASADPDALVALLSSALGVVQSGIDDLEERSTSVPQTAPSTTPSWPSAAEARLRSGSTATSNLDSESSRTGGISSLTKDDTLGDLVGTLHQLNQFFTEEQDGAYDTPRRAEGVARGSSRQTSMSSLEWNLRSNTPTSPIDGLRNPSSRSLFALTGRETETSSDSDGFRMDEEHTLSPQVEAWRYMNGNRHKAQQPSMSSTGSAQKGRNMFDLEEDTTDPILSGREVPRQQAPRKPGQLRTLMMGGSTVV